MIETSTWGVNQKNYQGKIQQFRKKDKAAEVKPEKK